MMDLNSKINWSPGMEITAQTFIGLEEKLALQQRIAMRAALGSTRMGMLPGATLSCDGTFVKNAFEIEHLQCMSADTEILCYCTVHTIYKDHHCENQDRRNDRYHEKRNYSGKR